MGMRRGSLLCPRWEACAPVVVAEWLRRWTRNPLGSPRAGSNPADYAAFRGEVAVTFFLVPSTRFPLCIRQARRWTFFPAVGQWSVVIV